MAEYLQNIVTVDDLLATANEVGLAKFKIPHRKNIFFTTEMLPRGATGKILKAGVRELIAKRTGGSKL